MEENKVMSEEEIKSSVSAFIKTKECPNCKKLIDAIVVGEDGIRCEFCKEKNILEQMSLASKIDVNAVLVQDFVSSVSEFYEKKVDEEGKVIDSPSFKFHMSEDIMDGDINKFLREYVSLFVFCKRDIAQTVIPAANVIKTKANIALKKDEE